MGFLSSNERFSHEQLERARRTIAGHLLVTISGSDNARLLVSKAARLARDMCAMRTLGGDNLSNPPKTFTTYAFSDGSVLGISNSDDELQSCYYDDGTCVGWFNVGDLVEW